MALKHLLAVLKYNISLSASEQTESDEKVSETDYFLGEASTRRVRPRRVWPYVMPWMIATAALGYIAIFQYLAGLPPRQGTFETGWATDFKPARSYVVKQEVMFNGGPVFDPNGTYYVPHHDVADYAGKPSPAVDQAWEELTWGRYVLLTEKEAKDSFGNQYGDISEFWSPLRGGYIAGFDMFHTLHCLDRVRKALHPEYYPRKEGHNNIIHEGHCIEQIRQYIMCSGDMTPIPTRYSESRNRSYVESDVKHTCRNFEMLREFLGERYNGSLAVKPDCEHGVVSERGSTSCRFPDS